MKQAIAEFGSDDALDESVWESFAKRLFYLGGDFSESEHLSKLKNQARRDRNEIRNARQSHFLSRHCARLLWLDRQTTGRSKAGAVQRKESWTRIIVEKPFGHDLESARALNKELAKVFDEKQVYRIDHYLGKETVQNLLAFRFANSIFEPLWNRQYIDHIQITNAETLGVEGRGGYYEKAGALRDMIQNHVFQVTSLIAMEPPASLSANSVRDEKAKAMQSVRAFPLERSKIGGARAIWTGQSSGRHGAGISRRAGRRSKIFN